MKLHVLLFVLLTCNISAKIWTFSGDEDKFNSIPYASCDFLTGISKEAGTGILSKVNNFLIYIYPNPAEDYIEISFERCPISSRCWTSDDISIYNVLGECFLSIPYPRNPNPKRMDVSDLPSGIYFLKVGSKVSKFIKL